MSALTICSLMIYWSGWSVVSKIGWVFAIGYIVYSVMCLSRSQMRGRCGYKQVIQGCWVWFYIPGLAALSYCGSFGGCHWISFGADFVWSAVLSIATYVVAYGCNKTARVSLAPLLVNV